MEDPSQETMIWFAFLQDYSSLTIPSGRVTHHFSFPNSFCQNPAGSWIPQCHLWLLCDPALYSHRHPCPHHHLDWKRNCCEFHLYGDLSGEDPLVLNLRAENIFVELPWSLSLVSLASPFFKIFQYFHSRSHRLETELHRFTSFLIS